MVWCGVVGLSLLLLPCVCIHIPPPSAIGIIDMKNPMFQAVQQMKQRVEIAHGIASVDAPVKQIKQPAQMLAYTATSSRDKSSVMNILVSSFMSNQVLRISHSVEKNARLPKVQSVSVFASGTYCIRNHPCVSLDGPWGMAMKRGVLFVASFGTDHILMFNASDVIDYDKASDTSRQFSSSQRFIGAFGDSSELNCPQGLAFGPDGMLYVSSYLNNQIVRYRISWEDTSSGLRVVGSLDRVVVQGSPYINGPEDVAFDRLGGLLVTSYHNNSIVRFSSEGKLKSVVQLKGSRGPPAARRLVTGEMDTTAEASGPVGMTTTADGDVLVAMYRSHSIVRYKQSLTGQLRQHRVEIAGKKFIRGPSCVCVTSSRSNATMFVGSYNNNQLVVYDMVSRQVYQFLSSKGTQTAT